MMNTYLSPLKTCPRANITFSDSNNTSSNPAEDLGNLPAEPTQSEITSELSAPELSGDLFNSVNPLSTGKEGRVTTVVAKARHKTTENQPVRTTNNLQGVVPVTQSSRSY